MVPGSAFSTQDRHNNYVRLSCTGIWNEQMAAGLRTLGEFASEMA